MTRLKLVRRIGAGLLVAVLAIGGAACGDSDPEDEIDQTEQQIEDNADEAEQNLEDQADELEEDIRETTP